MAFSGWKVVNPILLHILNINNLIVVLCCVNNQNFLTWLIDMQL